jgi:uncharacterized damage-inducible protein DinB
VGDLSSAAMVRDLLVYTLWADRRMLKAVEAVRPEDLVRDTGSSFPSLLATSAHLLGAQRTWLSRFAGRALERVPGIADFPDFAALAAGFAETAAEMEFFLAAVTDAQLAADIRYANTRGETFALPLWQPVMQLVNHSTYHRGQLTTMLRQLGYAAPQTDFIYFCLERAAAPV